MNRLWGGTRTSSREHTEDSADILADEPSTATEHEAEASRREGRIEGKSEAEPHPETRPESASEADAEQPASDTVEREVGDHEDDAPEGARAPGQASFASARRRFAVVASAAVLLIAGAGFFSEAHQARSTPSAGNHALTDTEATNRVAGDVDNALARVFSYTPKGTDATEKSARSVLTGRAARQYGELFDRVRSDLAGQKVSLTTVAVRTGVVELRGGTATLLVFLDQTSRRGNAKESYAAAQLSVTARFENDRWLIADIQTR
ncbi:hypothetical protein ABZ341_15675 [Streptomyces sp. NPDC006173]|uniref:hypothetical protein n=1 Tax=Streptomyces sp. NPDC006173 TaxID=3155349 RepID=UPI003404A891